MMMMSMMVMMTTMTMATRTDLEAVLFSLAVAHSCFSSQSRSFAWRDL